MRFTKKLLATLLPITAAATIAPVLSSCNKGNGYSINYGDTINCLNEKEKDYHSINDVKNAVKDHTSIESLPSIAVENLPHWNDGLEVQQKMYFDLIASHAIKDDEKQQIKFALTWAVKDSQLNVKFDTSIGTQIHGDSAIAYVADETTPTQIDLKITCNTGTTYSIKSYSYQYTELRG